MTISLVISSRNEFDSELVSRALGMPPTRIWRRKEGLKVHGPDTIPKISWIFEKQFELETPLEIAVCGLLDAFGNRSAQLVSIARQLNLEVTVVCRIVSSAPEQEVDLSSSALARLVQFGCGLVWSTEIEVDPK